MNNEINKPIDSGDIPVIRIEKTHGDVEEIQRLTRRLLMPEDIASRMDEILYLMEKGPLDVKKMFKITMNIKTGIVPDKPPERFKAIPDDITSGVPFVSGEALLPIPICKSHSGGGFTWQLLRTSFSFYKEEGKQKILIPFYVYEQSSDSLKPRTDRISERQTALEKIRTRCYGEAITSEIFYPLKDKLEPIFLRWINEKVQEMIDTGELRRIFETIEKHKEWFAHSDLQIDADATGIEMNKKLDERLRRPSPIRMPSCQLYVGKSAQDGWLELCKTPSYDLAGREREFIEHNIDSIVKAIPSIDHVMIFGLGDAEKEKFLLEKLLEKQGNKKMNVHGIDVGSEFHLRAFEGMQAIQAQQIQAQKQPVRYRGYIALFESAAKIAKHIRERSRRRAKSIPKTLRVSLGNTFGNFDDQWSVFAKGMETGDMLMITSDIIPEGSSVERGEKIKNILTRYEIPEWKKWVLHPLYRAGFSSAQISPDNVKVEWDEESSGIIFTYTFTTPTTPVGNSRGRSFGPGDSIKLYRSKKIVPTRFACEAEGNGFKIKKCLADENGDFGCFILEKVEKSRLELSSVLI